MIISRPYISILSLIVFSSIILYIKIMMLKSIGNESQFILGNNYSFTIKDGLSILFIIGLIGFTYLILRNQYDTKKTIQKS